MTTIKGPPRNQSVPLPISPEAHRRFIVGLSWDPRSQPKVSVHIPHWPAKRGLIAKFFYLLLSPIIFLWVFFKSTVRLLAMDKYFRLQTKDEDKPGRDRKAPHYDLDLSCYIFDADLSLLRVIGPEGDALIDDSKKVYHSGENQGGFGGPDDEILSVETRDLPPEYHHFFFVVKSDSKHNLADIINPAIRLADARTNENALQNAIAPQGVDAHAHGYVFCHVWRSGDGFMFRNIDSYTGYDEDWADVLTAFAKEGAR